MFEGWNDENGNVYQPTYNVADGQGELMIDPPNVKVTCEEMTTSTRMDRVGSEDLTMHIYHHFVC